MSLQVWLPLDGSLENRGLANVSVTNNGATVDNNGKIGKCYSINGSGYINSGYGKGKTIDNLSICCWFKFSTIENNKIVFGSPNGSNQRCYLGYTGSKWLIAYGNVSWSTANGDSLGATVNIWQHLALVIKNKTMNLYIDGVKQGQQIALSTAPIAPDNIFALNYNTSTSYTPKGSINDFRIYNHALSDREVKEIAQAKVLHYPLSKYDAEKDNLVYQNEYDIYNNHGVTASLTKLNEKYMGQNIYRLSMTPDSAHLDSWKTLLHSHGIRGFHKTFKANTKYCFWILYRPVSHPDVRVGGTASNIGDWHEIAPKSYHNGWSIVGQYRNGVVTTDKTDNIFTSFYCPSAQEGVPIVIDFVAPHLYEGTQEYYPSYYNNYLYKDIVDKSIYIEPDGSRWLRVFHHNNPASKLFTNPSNLDNTIYTDGDRWAYTFIFNQMNKWELMIKQRLTSESTDTTVYSYRWVQNVNPYLAVFEDVANTKVTYNMSSVYTAPPSAYGGLYKFNSSAYFVANNNIKGNWWGAVGAWSTHQGGIPAWGGQVVTTGYEDLYVRIDNLDTEQFYTEYDISGYNHHGILSGSVSPDIESIRYTRCYDATIDSSFSLNIGNLTKIVSQGTFTFNIWFKKDTDKWSGKGYETIFGGPSGFELEMKRSGTNSPAIFLYNATNGDSSKDISYTLDKWHMLTFIRLTDSSKIYLDGELKQTVAASGFPNNEWFIGSWQDTSKQNYRGHLSDARIYATALSASDIQELYNLGREE